MSDQWSQLTKKGTVTLNLKKSNKKIINKGFNYATEIQKEEMNKTCWNYTHKKDSFFFFGLKANILLIRKCRQIC